MNLLCRDCMKDKAQFVYLLDNGDLTLLCSKCIEHLEVRVNYIEKEGKGGII